MIYQHSTKDNLTSVPSISILKKKQNEAHLFIRIPYSDHQTCYPPEELRRGPVEPSGACFPGAPAHHPSLAGVPGVEFDRLALE